MRQSKAALTLAVFMLTAAPRWRCKRQSGFLLKDVRTKYF